MRFLILRKADKMTEAGTFPPNADELFASMGRYMEEMQKAGVLLGGEGLKPSSSGFRVQIGKTGKPQVIDGPFAETKELVAGYTLIQVKSREEALEWVRRWPQNDAFAEGGVTLEVRQIYEADDFGDAFTPEERAREERLRAELANKK